MSSTVAWVALAGVLLVALVLSTLASGVGGTAGALLIAAAAVIAAWVQRRRTGPWAPLWIAVFVLVSPLGPATASRPMVALAVLATSAGLGLVMRRELPAGAPVKELWDVELEEPRRRFLARWAAVGALLALPLVARPLHAALLFAIALAVPRHRRVEGTSALVGGALLGALVATVLELGGESLVAAEGGAAGLFWPLEQPVLFGRDLLALLLGAHVGILVGFPALLLVLWASEGGRRNWALLGAVTLVLVGAVVARPFDFWGGAGNPPDAATFNRWLVPLYPVLWYLPSRHARPLPALLPVLVVLLLVPRPWLGAWLRPAAPQLETPAVRALDLPTVRFADRWLPIETSQRFLHPSGLEDRRHAGLWLRRLDRASVVSDSVLAVRSERVADYLVAHDQPLEALIVRVSAPGPDNLLLDGGEIHQLMLSPDGSVSFELDLEPAVTEHPTWWTDEPVSFYRLRLVLPVTDGVEEHTLRFRRGRLLEREGGEEAGG